MADESPSHSTESADGLSQSERAWLDAVRSADSLEELADIVETPSEHDAYLQAKERWKRLRRREVDTHRVAGTSVPGARVEFPERQVFVHGITHAGTDEERHFLREHVQEFLDSGASVYCEQGIRPMYFDDFEEVCEVDDYRWAMHHCQEQDINSHVSGEIERGFDKDGTISADIRSVTSAFKDRTFTLIEAGKNMYGDRFTSALGDVASDFLTSHEELATGEDFGSFRISREAARNPERLTELQQYYDTVFLPQPLEREWLRRHDPELELFTHARNERIAAYVLYNAPAETPVHVVTGAAHQSGIVYYLDAYRDGEWEFEPFETVP